MRYKIFKDGELVNTIVADEAFCKAYCEKHGYTYELEELPEPEETETEPTELEHLRADVDYLLMMEGA